MPWASFSMLDGPGGTKFLQSEVKIIHIIVQNNTYYSARSRWTKQQHLRGNIPRASQVLKSVYEIIYASVMSGEGPIKSI